MRFDGTDRRARIKVTGFTVNAPSAEPNLADEILVSPDSQQVVALVNNYVYLVNLPMTGQQPITISIADPTASVFPARRLTKIGGDFIGVGGRRRERHLVAGAKLLPVRWRLPTRWRSSRLGRLGPGRLGQGPRRQARFRLQGPDRFAGQGAGL